MLIRFRPIADRKYQQALRNMNVPHGSSWDCNRECSTCQPYRDLERAYWDSLTDKQKHEVRFFKWGI